MNDDKRRLIEFTERLESAERCLKYLDDALECDSLQLTTLQTNPYRESHVKGRFLVLSYPVEKIETRKDLRRLNLQHHLNHPNDFQMFQGTYYVYGSPSWRTILDKVPGTILLESEDDEPFLRNMMTIEGMICVGRDGELFVTKKELTYNF